MEETFIVGKCMDFCPLKEVKMREREGLLHRLEMGANFLPVKEFQRSAAGKQQDTYMTIRPPEVLQQTITYLFNSVLSSDASLDAYNFVENRLRSVRQDLFKQQCPGHFVLPILEPIIRFYAWATFWYSELPTFDSYLNDVQLLECLKTSLRVADESNEMPSSDIEALYLLLNLGNVHPLLRSFSLPKKRRSPLLLKSEKLSLDWHMSNYVRVCGKIKELPVLLAALISAKHYPTIRRHALSTMSVAYNSRNLTVPLSLLVSIGLFEDRKEAEEHCLHYGLQIRDSSVSFQKTSFNHSVKEVVGDGSIKPIDVPVLIEGIGCYLLQFKMNVWKKAVQSSYLVDKITGFKLESEMSRQFIVSSGADPYGAKPIFIMYLLFPMSNFCFEKVDSFSISREEFLCGVLQVSSQTSSLLRTEFFFCVKL